MIEQDYVDFCNEAFDLASRAQGYLAKLSEEDLRQLQGLVQSEMGAAQGDVAPGYNFLKVMLDDEIEDRAKYPSREFRDAVTTFVSATTKARDDLASALAKLADPEWHRARDALENWIERSSKNAAAYQSVIEMADLERTRIARAQGPIDLPF